MMMTPCSMTRCSKLLPSQRPDEGDADLHALRCHLRGAAAGGQFGGFGRHHVQQGVGALDVEFIGQFGGLPCGGGGPVLRGAFLLQLVHGCQAVLNLAHGL
jgi:hypothetical protein